MPASSSAISYALNSLHNSDIPEEILERAFLDNVRLFSHVVPDIDHFIENKVIRSRVMRDINLKYSERALINLTSIPREIPDERSSLYIIPSEYLQGRQIISPEWVSYGYGYSIAYSNYNPWFDQMQQKGSGNAGVLVTGAALWNAYANMPIVGSARVSLVNVNTVLVEDQVRIPDRCWLSCWLTYDDELSTLRPAVYGEFAQLVEYAAKAYIYKHLIVKLNEGEIVGGFDFGIFKSVIEGYSDANQNYKDFLKNTWYKVAMMQSQSAHVKHIRNFLGTQR